MNAERPRENLDAEELAVCQIPAYSTFKHRLQSSGSKDGFHDR